MIIQVNNYHTSTNLFILPLILAFVKKVKKGKPKARSVPPQSQLADSTPSQGKATKKKPQKKLIRRPDSKVKKRARVTKSKKDQVPNEVKWMQEDPQDQLLSRFVETPKGTVVGESIGIEKSMIILKNKLKFYSVPLKYVKEKDDKLILKRKIDWSKAEKLGELWRKEALDVLPKNKPKKSKRSKKLKSK